MRQPLSSLWLCVGLLVCSAPLHAQTVSTAISRDTIRVGDPFRAIVRIDVPAGVDIIMPDSLPNQEDIENAGAARIRRDSIDGTLRIVASYPVTAWRPGGHELPPITVHVKSAAGDYWRVIELPAIDVVSVLPADTTNIEAKPAKDVLGANRLWWPWLIAALVLLAALAAAYWWYRKHRKPALATAPELTVSPRERALAELDRIRKLGLIEEQSYKRYYSLLAEALRQYMATADPSWSTDLTTDELARNFWRVEEIRPAIYVLRNSDMVKFAKHTPSEADARRDFDRTSDWIRTYPVSVSASVPVSAESAA